ncbi:hypothetical protein [Jatrophihabitans sp.]|uniref:hypothetical protein n=1 Tax=Jatrophihabitans sp. TaxID=1932789 RepID=UPI002BDCD5A9|nr:hypothetical protein [Jatrophihabitans sp.]
MKVGATTAGSVEESAAAGPDEAFGLTLFAEGVNVPMILDTGSQLSFASYEWFESHDLVKGADETPLLSMRIATGGGRTDVTVLPLARDWIISIDDSTTARCFFQVYLILNWSESPFAEVSDVGVLGRQALRDNGFRLEIRLTDEYPLRRIFGPL